MRKLNFFRKNVKVLRHNSTNLSFPVSFLLTAFILPSFLGCATVELQPTRSTPVIPSRAQPSKKPLHLNKKKLANELGIYSDKTDIGFKQVSFNDCSIAPSFRKNKGCSTQFLAIINFRMRCRNSEGTVEQQVTNYELEPLTSNSIKWELGKLQGHTKTDSRGYGQVIVRSWSRIDNKQFRLTANGQIMGVSAKQVRQFVLPRYWCN